ncbi:hypothetical protein [uncultured Roseobacter sp.]|uniref:hypothetical protein n=1 Tax=uncultured Roseobacter sp. TaxID=114847 RepID=UPI00260FBBF3|nr:hypothetical protein [uncultured Roseobacter sp.]
MPSSSQTTDPWRINHQRSENPYVKSGGYEPCLDDPDALDDSLTEKIAAEWLAIDVTERSDHPGRQDRRSVLRRCRRPSPGSTTRSARVIPASAPVRFIQEL